MALLRRDRLAYEKDFNTNDRYELWRRTSKFTEFFKPYFEI